MDSAKLHDWLQIAGMVAIVASLVFVGLQFRQSEDIAQADVSLGQGANYGELSALMAEHADIWLRACAGEELSVSEQFIANNIFARWLQNNYFAFVRLDSTELGLIKPRVFTDKFAANIHRYPGFSKMASAYSDWSDLGLRNDGNVSGRRYVEYLYERLGELEKEEPNPKADVAWCGVI